MSTTEKLKADWAKEITEQVIAITKQVEVLTKACHRADGRVGSARWYDDQARAEQRAEKLLERWY